MHEMAIAASLISIIEQSMAEHNASKLLLARVRYGTLTLIEPESLLFSFEALTKNNPALANAQLEFVQTEALLKCGACQQTFTPQSKEALFEACPHCHAVTSHTLLAGRELFLDHLEAE